MKLALQILSWAIVAVCVLAMFGIAMEESTGVEAVLGIFLFGTQAVLTLLYIKR